MEKKRPKRISKKFDKMCEIYCMFLDDVSQTRYSFTEKDKLAQFCAETFGEECSGMNGYALGKKTMDVTVAMWLEVREEGMLHIPELYSKYPNEWLNKIFNRNGPYNNGPQDAPEPATEDNWKMRTKIMETENERLNALIRSLDRQIEILELPWYKRLFK